MEENGVKYMVLWSVGEMGKGGEGLLMTDIKTGS